MKVDTQEVYYIARLARIKIDKDRVEVVSQRLSEILGYMSKLETLDFDGDLNKDPFESLNNVLREDKLTDRVSHNEALSESPHPDSNYFRVPKVIS